MSVSSACAGFHFQQSGCFSCYSASSRLPPCRSAAPVNVQGQRSRQYTRSHKLELCRQPLPAGWAGLCCGTTPTYTSPLLATLQASICSKQPCTPRSSTGPPLQEPTGNGDMPMGAWPTDEANLATQHALLNGDTAPPPCKQAPAIMTCTSPNLLGCQNCTGATKKLYKKGAPVCGGEAQTHHSAPLGTPARSATLPRPGAYSGGPAAILRYGAHGSSCTVSSHAPLSRSRSTAPTADSLHTRSAPLRVAAPSAQGNPCAGGRLRAQPGSSSPSLFTPWARQKLASGQVGPVEVEDAVEASGRWLLLDRLSLLCLHLARRL